MKRKIIAVLLLFVLIFVSTSCSALQLKTGKDRAIEKQDSNGATAQNQSKDEDNKGNVLQTDPEEYIKNIIDKRAIDVLTEIKNYDMNRFADAIHPDKGVRFSPYGYVDVENNLVFTAGEIRKLAADSKIYLW
jgi:hypothetical protein